MNQTAFWLISIGIAVVIVIVILALMEYCTNYNTPPAPNPTPITPTLSRNSLALHHESCATTACGSGLVCTNVPNYGQICLGGIGHTCLVNQDCNSGYCNLGSNQEGICMASSNTLLGSSNPSGTTQIYTYNSSTFTPGITIPSGITLTRVSTTNGKYLGISSSSVYYNSGSSWTNLSTTFTSPGTLVDGVIVTVNGVDTIYLVYLVSNGSTYLYTFNVSTSSLTSLGVQMTTSSSVITITQFDVHPSGEIYLVGTTSGGMSTLFRKSNLALAFTPITLATAVMALPTRSSNDYAIVTGTSIIIMGYHGVRYDNLPGMVVSFTVSPDQIPYYVIGTSLYQGEETITSPTTINANTRLYYSIINGVSLYTPGY